MTLTSLADVYSGRHSPPDNIFKLLRQHCALSHVKLADLMGTTKYALIRLEQGMFEQPLPVAMEFWLSSKGQALIEGSSFRITELTLLNEYEAFQEATRTFNHHYFGPILVCNYSATAPHPLFQLQDLARKAGHESSEMAIAKALCVPQSSINLWGRKWRIQQSVPKNFQKALLLIGYSRHEVQRFVEGYVKWREVNK